VALPPQRPGARPGASGNGSDDPVAERYQDRELADQCQELEEGLEQLKARYEMWFLGVEKREPNRDRDELKRRVERIKTAFTRNTGLKFRIQTLAARFLSYERMWLRSVREKEAGTYRRDLERARRRARERKVEEQRAAGDPAAPAAAGASPSADPPARYPVAGAAAQPEAGGPPAAPPRADTATPLPFVPPRPPPPPARAPAPGGPVAERQLRALYDAYIEAKRRCNEDVSRLTYEAVARSVQKQVPELLAKYKATSVEFKVVIQGGKAVLKAVPRG